MKTSAVEKLREASKHSKSMAVADAAYYVDHAGWIDRATEIATIVLRELRVQQISQNELSRRMNVSPQYISKMLRGKENLTLETIAKVEHALRITLIQVHTSTPKTQNKTKANAALNTRRLSNSKSDTFTR